jgi:hypothetical protein
MNWYPLMDAALELATAGRPVRNGEDLICLARALVLLGLRDGPRTFPELPRAWPVSRALLFAAVRDLVIEGLVATGAHAPHARLALTPQGRDTLGVARGEMRRSA